MTYNLGSIGDNVYALVENITPSISGSLPILSNLALTYVNNYLRETISGSAIPDNRASVVTNTAAMLALSRINNVNLGFNWTIGEWRIDKTNTPISAQMQMMKDLVNMELRMIPMSSCILSKCNG